MALRKLGWFGETANASGWPKHQVQGQGGRKGAAGEASTGHKLEHERLGASCLCDKSSYAGPKDRK